MAIASSLEASLEAFFLPVAEGGRCFCLFHPPSPTVPRRGAVLYLPPFAEEMNKARRMAALQARAMAAAGYAVLQIDLRGCGDSSGDFGEASWQGWLADIESACDWLRSQSAFSTGGEFWLWGLRSGCLLATALLPRLKVPCRLFFWQPLLSGKVFLQQFLRLKLAADVLAGDAKGAMSRLREQLAAGNSVEVAGYALSAELANGLELSELVLPEALPSRVAQVEWIEIAGKTGGELSPAASARIEKWRTEGFAVRGRSVLGAAFWQTVEITECPALIEASLQAMMSAEPS